MNPNPQLYDFLAPYDEHIQKLVLDLRGFVVDWVPEANELIWDNYNAVAIAYSKSKQLKDAFCHLAVYVRHVNFGFNRGTELTSTALQLDGSGKLIRHLTVKNLETFPKDEIASLVREAVQIAEERNSALKGLNEAPQSIVMSVSKKKLRPKTRS